jgi:hypothetical protein
MVPMADDVARYSGAIEESAKTAGKALDLIKDASGPIAQAYGLIIGDRVEAARHRRLDEITRKTRKILRDRNLSEAAEVAEQIAIPLLEAAQGEPREEMQDLWARLLANAMDPSRKDNVRPEFIRALKNLQPVDALVLKSFTEFGKQDLMDANTVANSLNLRESSVQVSMSTLASQGCLNPSGTTLNGQLYQRTGFGDELFLACSA